MNERVKEVIKTLKSLQPRVRKECKAEIVGIFGSFARSDETEQSDIDVLVEFEDGATLLDFVWLSDFLEERLKRKVDVVSKRALREEIKPYVFKEIINF